MTRDIHGGYRNGDEPSLCCCATSAALFQGTFSTASSLVRVLITAARIAV